LRKTRAKPLGQLPLELLAVRIGEYLKPNTPILLNGKTVKVRNEIAFT
jgi:hypothetical protein